MHAAFAEAFNARDIDQLVALYEADAMLAPLPGKRVRGLAEIRISHQKLLALGGRMTAETHYCMQVGDIALLRGAWQVKGIGANGAAFEISGHSAEVVRKQANGAWLYVIDHAHAND